METKKYWQTLDDLGRYEVYAKSKPETYKDELGRVKFNGVGHEYVGQYQLFPIPLKPLQIAEITVCENGTWTYEIEREEGWYMAKWKHDNQFTIVQYEGGGWKLNGNHGVHESDILKLTISSTRIPDECII